MNYTQYLSSITVAAPWRGNTALTCDVPPALSTARVTDRAQQMTWILKKDPRKLLQPRANISCTWTCMWYSKNGLKYKIWISKRHMQFFHLVGVHVIAMLGCQSPAHSQVDDIPHNCQGESCAQHVFPLTHCWQDWCWESEQQRQEIRLNWMVNMFIHEATIVSEYADVCFTPKVFLLLCPCDRSQEDAEGLRWLWPPPPV